MGSVRWTDVAHDFLEETTALAFGTNASKECLFNLTTLATVEPVFTGEDDHKNSITVPVLHASSNKNYVAFSADCDLNIFTLEPIACKTISYDAVIVNLTWIPGSCVLLCVTADMLMYVIYADLNQTLCKKALNKTSNATACTDVKSAVKTNENGGVTVMFSCHKSLIKCEFGDIDGLNYALDEQNLKAIKENLGKLEISCVPCAQFLQVSTFDPDGNTVCVSPRSLQLYSDEGFEEILSFEHFDYGSPIKSQLAGQFYLVLCENGTLLLQDALSGVLLSHMGENIVDFVVIDKKLNSNRLDMKIMTIKKQNIAKEGECLLEIVDLSNKNVEYSCAIPEHSRLVYIEGENDNNPMIIEFRNNDQLRLRAVFEATPQAKLMKFLAKGNFKDAENFAKLFKLDLQTVYMKELTYSVTNLSGYSLNQEKFDRLLFCIEKLNDPNLVLKNCIQICKLLPKQEWIKHVVSLGEQKLKATAVDYWSLSRIGCLQRTYSIVMGQHASTSIDTYWQAIVNNTEDATPWLNVLLGLLNVGKLDGASRLWARESGNIRKLLKKTMGYANLLNTVFEAITRIEKKDEEKRNEISNLMEYQILPECLLDASDVIGAQVSEWLLQICYWLEGNSANHWPRNALQWAGMVKRIAHSFWTENDGNYCQPITPAQISQAAYCCNQLQLDCPEKDTPIFKLLALENDLDKLHKLHTVYKCSISYDLYCRQTVQSICYRILDKEQAVNCLSKYIVQYATPYMQDNQLDDDETLNAYVIDVLQSLSDVGTKELRAVAVIQCIKSEDWRLRSIVELAKRASIPWSKQISQCVLSVAHTKHPVCEELKEVCELAELKTVVNKYLISATQLATCMTSRDTMITLVQYIFKEAPQRHLDGLADSLKVAQLSKIVPVQEVYAFHAMKLIKQSRFLVVLELMQSLPAELSLIVSEKVFLRLAISQESLKSVDRDMCEIMIVLYSKYLSAYLSEEKKAHYSRYVQTARKLAKDIKQTYPSELLCLCGEPEKESVQQMLEDFVRSVVEHGQDADYVYCRIQIQAVTLNVNDQWLLLTTTLKLCKQMNHLALSCHLFRLFVMHSKLKLSQVQMICGGLLASVLSLKADDKILAINTCYQVFRHCSAKLDVQEETNVVELLRLCRLCKSVCTTLCNPSIDRTHVFGMDKVHGVYTYVHEDCVGLSVEDVTSCLCRALASHMTDNDATQEWNSVINVLHGGGHRLLSLILQLQIQRGSKFALTLAGQFVQSLVMRASSTPLDYMLCSGICLVAPNPKDVLKMIQALCSQMAANSFRPWTLLAGVGLMVSCLLFCAKSPSKGLIKTCADLLLQIRWCSKLAKHKVHMHVMQTNLTDRMKVVKDMAQSNVAASVMAEFVHRFGLNIVDCALLYVEATVTPYNPQRDMKCAEQSVKAVLRLLTKQTAKSFNKERVVSNLEHILFQVDPYDYESIALILEVMQDMGKTQQQNNLKSILLFVQNYARISKPGEGEKLWYAERCATPDLSQDPDATALDLLGTCEAPAPIKTLPDVAANRLPFHPFIPQKNPTHDNRPSSILKKIVMNHELNLNTLEEWQQFAKEQAIVPFSGEELVMQTVRNIVADGCMDKLVFDRLCKLFKRSDEHGATLKCIGDLVKKLNMGEVKLRAAQCGRDIANDWLCEAKNKQDTQEMREAEKYQMAFEKACLTLGTEFLIRKTGLYNDSTKMLISPNPNKLILYILEHCQLNDEVVSCIQTIAQLTNTDLCGVLDSVVDKWLVSHNAHKQLNLDDTVVGLPLMKDRRTEKVKVDYFAEDLNRLVVILKQREIQRTCNQLLSEVSRAKGFDKIRPLICMLRIVSPRGMGGALLAKSAADFRNEFEECLYHELMTDARLSHTIESMNSVDKKEMVANLMRNTAMPAVCILVASMIIDNQLLISAKDLSILCKSLAISQDHLLNLVMYANKMDTVSQDAWKHVVLQKLPTGSKGSDCNRVLKIFHAALRCPRFSRSNAETLKSSFDKFDTIRNQSAVLLTIV